MVQPARAAALLGTATVLCLAGPFGTEDAMRLFPRLAYWLVLVVLGYSIGYGANLAAEHLAKPRAPVWQRVAIAWPLTALGVLALVYVLNGAALGYWATGRPLAVLALNIAAITLIVDVVFQIAHSTAPLPDQQTVPLLDRLPLDKRAPLVALSVEDHYVRVRTTKGEEMLLMRLADAMREVGGTPGLQVHRSHWIALGQVTGTTRKGDGALLAMTCGTEIPVSRANMPAIKEAGLLPR